MLYNVMVWTSCITAHSHDPSGYINNMEFLEQLRNCKLPCMALLLELGALKLIVRNMKETRNDGRKEREQ
jgi:hypothetical protein